jgi:hypothetical protein
MNADERLNNLKNTFASIINKRNSLFNIFTQQQTKIQLLKTNYAEYVKNNTSSVLIFGLDSFHFQSKLLDIEYEELNKFFSIINNRIYCEYFKLYKLIIEYLLKNIKEPKLLDMTKMIHSFPIYKDLEPYKEYDIQIVNDIHEQIILLLTGFNIFITSKETILKTYIQKKEIGFNIDNFVNTYNYEIIIIRQKLMLFFDYIDFFHKIHSKYLNTFSAKLTLMINELNRDIKPHNENSDIEMAEINVDEIYESIEEPNTSLQEQLVTSIEESKTKDTAQIEEQVVSVIEESMPEESVVAVIEESKPEDPAPIEESVVAVIEEPKQEEPKPEEPLVIIEESNTEEPILI